MIWSLRLAAIGLCLASISFAQTDSSNRTPNLHLLYTSDQKLNQNFSRLDEVLGPIGKAFDPTTNPKGTRIGYNPICDCFGFFDAATNPLYDFDITKSDPNAALVLNLQNTGALGAAGVQLRSIGLNYVTFVTSDGTGGYTIDAPGNLTAGTEIFQIVSRSQGTANIQTVEPGGATQIQTDIYPSTTGSGLFQSNPLRFFGSKGQNTTGTTGQTAGNGAQTMIVGGAGGNAPSGATNGAGGHAAIYGGDAGSGAGASGAAGNAIVDAGSNTRGAAGNAYVMGGNATGVPGGTVVLQGGTGTPNGGVQIGTTITAQTATIHTVLFYALSVALPSVTAPNCNDGSVLTATGANLGDGVVLGIPLGAIATIGSIYTAYAGGDTVKIRHCCMVGTCNPGTQTFNIWIIH